MLNASYQALSIPQGGQMQMRRRERMQGSQAGGGGWNWVTGDAEELQVFNVISQEPTLSYKLIT